MFLCASGFAVLAFVLFAFMCLCGTDAVFLDDIMVVSVESVPDSTEHSSYLAEVQYDGVSYDVLVSSRDIKPFQFYKTGEGLFYLSNCYYYFICFGIALGTTLILLSICLLLREKLWK